MLAGKNIGEFANVHDLAKVFPFNHCQCHGTLTQVIKVFLSKYTRRVILQKSDGKKSQIA